MTSFQISSNLTVLLSDLILNVLFSIIFVFRFNKKFLRHFCPKTMTYFAISKKIAFKESTNFVLWKWQKVIAASTSLTSINACNNTFCKNCTYPYLTSLMTSLRDIKASIVLKGIVIGKATKI